LLIWRSVKDTRANWRPSATQAAVALSGPISGNGPALADTVCSECHGTDMTGAPDNSSPSLAIVTAYSRDDFDTLMNDPR
jgi:cytochrome c5